MSWLSDAIQRYADSKQPPYPTVLMPTVIKGYIQGPVRCESMDGGEMYIEDGKLPSEGHQLIEYTPFDYLGKTWAVSNIQKKSPYGWLKFDPAGYCWWKMLRLQKQDANGNWIPGTEFGWYYREPWKWRFDFPGTKIDGILRHWIWTKGYAGAHYD